MQEILAIVRMNKTSATKKALVEAGVAGFTAFKVMGRGKLIDDPAVVAERKDKMMSMAGADEQDAEMLIDGFLDGHRLFPRRLFTILAHDEDVSKIVEAIMSANRTENKVGDGKIIIMPMLDAIRVRTGEAGEDAV
ncbi:Nitrogen regulatory protein P-II [Sporomusa silvacetica DSM 10669]|uniref:Nitrogen regulatory protein P-II n=1 Tax=Sporomusa silvacetica DSM 10669 TaxID=1123289 RepID=A0ABZ3IT41_9FIRM|nr:P-II family nitrogen regulator [Sporomusa silvacetica]OZC19749.1 nitrogen regulatory protein P-II [Sporomusa silvacetica DSM 10669]